MNIYLGVTAKTNHTLWVVRLCLAQNPEESINTTIRARGAIVLDGKYRDATQRRPFRSSCEWPCDHLQWAVHNPTGHSLSSFKPSSTSPSPDKLLPVQQPLSASSSDSGPLLAMLETFYLLELRNWKQDRGVQKSVCFCIIIQHRPPSHRLSDADRRMPPVGKGKGWKQTNGITNRTRVQIHRIQSNNRLLHKPGQGHINSIIDNADQPPWMRNTGKSDGLAHIVKAGHFRIICGSSASSRRTRRNGMYRLYIIHRRCLYQILSTP